MNRTRKAQPEREKSDRHGRVINIKIQIEEHGGTMAKNARMCQTVRTNMTTCSHL